MWMLYRVLYCSRNLVAGSTAETEHEIESILAKSRENNARDGITGGLLYSNGCFAQVLEGPLDAVGAAFERIQCDQRHRDVTVLQTAVISERDYPSWSMAFAGTSDATAGAHVVEAFSGRSAAGDDILALLKSVVVRDHEWLAH